MELLVTIIDSFHSLTIVKKISIFGVADVLDPTVITDIFAFAELITLKQIFSHVGIGQSILIAKNMTGCYETGIH